MTVVRRPAYNITFTQAEVSRFVREKSALFEAHLFVGSSVVKILAYVKLRTPNYRFPAFRCCWISNEIQK